MYVDNSWVKKINTLLLEEPLFSFYSAELQDISFQPRKDNIFKVFEMPLYKVNVVILGQDPYPTPNVAIGKAFAVSKESKIPASLRIIRNETQIEEGLELYEELGEDWKTLKHWTEQGVFLLNTALTVETSQAGSHIKYWENFTKEIIKFLSFSKSNIIWLLWGKKAQSFIPFIYNSLWINSLYEGIPTNKNYILSALHPAAELYSGGKGFTGCNHFSKTNFLLKHNKKNIIKW